MHELKFIRFWGEAQAFQRVNTPNNLFVVEGRALTLDRVKGERGRGPEIFLRVQGCKVGWRAAVLLLIHDDDATESDRPCSGRAESETAS